MRYRHYTGNHLADYTEHKEDCDACGGTGDVWVPDREDLRIYLANQPGRMKFGELRAIFQKWLDDELVPCLKCDGQGFTEHCW